MLRYFWMIGAALGAFPLAVQAEGALHSYAVVVGSNRGGAGQGVLSFAERDAERMADLVVELGRTPRAHVGLLKQPTPRELQASLATLRRTLEGHASRGERSQVFFYYSGHARARALSLGSEEFPLDALRNALTALPSTLTVVVLDACQSGAFSGVKGAEPAADFSVSSVNELHSQGIAVMASSTAAELSQESRELGSSYFSHHLIAALRGAGDHNADGRVSLDEAYGYAYHHTLSDTARTQVGTQHATLETDIRGRGDVPLSYPLDADAHLLLPSELEGRVLVQREHRGAVIAEMVKAAGSPLAFALPAGNYDVLVQASEAGGLRLCQVALARGTTHALSAERCQPVVVGAAAAKKGEQERDAQAPSEARPIKLRMERWFLEGGVVINPPDHRGPYDNTLHNFGYVSYGDSVVGAEAAFGWALHKNLSLIGHYQRLQPQQFEASRGSLDGGPSSEQTFAWLTRTVLVGARARLPLMREWVALYSDAQLGLGFARTHLEIDQKTYSDTHYGLSLRLALGIVVGLGRYVGTYTSLAYVHARVLENELGQTYDDAGFVFSTGLRIRGLKGGW